VYPSCVYKYQPVQKSTPSH